MAEEIKAPKVKVMTPKGRAVWASVNRPDVKFDPAGKYQLKLSFEPGEAMDAIIAKLEKLRDDFVVQKRAELQKGDGKAKARAKTLKVRDIAQPEYDKDGEETGNLLLSASMKASGVSQRDNKPWSRAPAVFDARGTKLKDVPAVYGGSTCKMAVEAQAYYKAADNEIGVALRLEAVQIIDLVSGGSRDASDYGFGEEEGFEADGQTFHAAGEDEDEGATKDGSNAGSPEDF